MNCDKYVIDTMTVNNKCILTFFNQISGKKAKVEITPQILINLLTMPDYEFSMMHFISWLNDDMPREISIAIGLGKTNPQANSARKAIMSSLNTQGVSKKAIGEIEDYLLNQ